MSRIGRMPIDIPAGVTVDLKEHTLTVQGPKGTLVREFNPAMNIEIDGNVISVTRPNDEPQNRALHGLTRALVANMVTGVSEGFKKTLEIQGVGYRAALQGEKLVLTLGYSHPVEVVAPEGITIEVPGPTKIVVSGASKEMVGEVAANIRKWRQPEPYKGKGIRYEGEVVRRKAGKAGAKGK